MMVKFYFSINDNFTPLLNQKYVRNKFHDINAGNFPFTEMLCRHDSTSPSISDPSKHDTPDLSTYESLVGSYSQSESVHGYPYFEIHECLSSGVTYLYCGHDLFGPSFSQSFLSSTDLTLYTAIFIKFFYHDVMHNDPYVVPELFDF
jgi:hypothetical protein